MDKKTFQSLVWLILLAAAALAAALNIQVLLGALSIFLKVLAPLLTGFVIAFILNRPYNAFYGWLASLLPAGRARRVAKPVAVLSTYICFLGLIVVVFSVLIPEMVNSGRTLAANLDGYLANMEWLFQWAAQKLNLKDFNQTNLRDLLQKGYDWVLANGSGALPQIFNFTQSLFSVVVDFFLGFVISVYILLSKDHLLSIAHRVNEAFLPSRAAAGVGYVASIANEVFSAFVGGQAIEACILGLMCFVSMTIFRFPYAPLISFIVGFSNFVPYVGPILGAGIGAFVMLMISPMKAVWFLVLVIVVQQIDNNLVYPRVVGSSVGLPALWVLVAILAGGSLFGLPGMLMGVPTLSVIYRLVKNETARRLALQGAGPENVDKPGDTGA